MTVSIFLIVLGVIAAYPFFLKKKPDLQQLFDKIIPVRGWLGLVFGIWSLVKLVQLLSFIDDIFVFVGAWHKICMILMVLIYIISVLIGFIFVLELVPQYIPSQKEKGDKIISILKPYYTKLGLLAIAAAIVNILISFSFN